MHSADTSLVPDAAFCSAAASAAATLAKMSAAQKIAIVHGYSGDYVGNVPQIGPLTDGSYIPALHLHDGPQGVANGNTQVTMEWSFILLSLP